MLYVDPMERRKGLKKLHSCQDHQHGSNFETHLEALKSQGLKLTQTRLQILETASHMDRPFSVDDLHRAIETRMKTSFDLVTVYRTAGALAEIGVFQRCDFGDGVQRFELVSEDGRHHHHIICRSCRRVEPLTICAIELDERLLKKTGFQQISHSLEFFGLCPACASS